MDYAYKNKLARQINGVVAQSLMKADHELYALHNLPEWFEHRRTLSLESATTEELDLIGKALGIPRPYVTTGAHAASLEIVATPSGYTANVAENTVHETIDGIVWELKDFIYAPATQKLAPPSGEQIVRYADDATYRLYIQNMAGLRRSKSLMSLADMLYTFNETGTFEIEFQETGDILIFLDETYDAYEPFLQVALDLVYNALPHLGPIRLVDYKALAVDSTVRTQYVNLVDPDWLMWVEQGTGFISCRNTDKISVRDDGLIEGTDVQWVYGDNGVGTIGYGVGFHKNTLYMNIGEDTNG